MKLSEAIRLGAMLKPQAFGDFTDGRGTCAMGAAHEAAGMPFVEDDYDPYDWNRILDLDVCPVCGPISHKLTIPAHLNDDHRWTREQIADWVASVEAAQETGQPAQSAALDPVDEVVAEVQRA